ncbi:MAG: hypothetical protein AMXMBFR58_12270 [Phycisphaerae bacterium]|nr:hypothetical protein [Phycisphaerales bacterium]
MIVALLLAAAPRALAQSAPTGDAPAPPAADHPDWTLRIEPAAWYTSLEGDLTMPGAPGSVQDTFGVDSLNLDESQWAPMGTVHVQAGKWRFTGSGFSYSNDVDQTTVTDSGGLGNLTLASGDVVSSSMDFWVLELQGAYRLVHRQLGTMQDGSPRLVFGLEPVVGVRMYSLDMQLDAITGASAGTSTSNDDFFFEPTAAVKLEGEFARQFTIDVQTGFGIGPWGDTESWSWDITVGGAWRPIPNLGIRIGYKHLLMDLKSGSGSDQFELDGSLGGLFVGAEIRF